MKYLIEAQGIEAPSLRCSVNNIKELSFTITHNIFKKTLKEDFVL
jgi:hypothetical protein